jgi:hypothetical protein
MAEFKVGDWAEVTEDCIENCFTFKKGERWRVTGYSSDEHRPLYLDLRKNVSYKDGYTECVSPSKFICVSSPSPTMSSTSLLTAARNIFRGEPEKSFIKAGIMSDAAIFTEDAKTLFLESLMKKDQADEKGFLQTLARDIIAEQEKAAK